MQSPRYLTVLIPLLLALLLPCIAEAQNQDKYISVTVAPDHKDWKYKIGETATFRVAVLRSGLPIDNVTVDYEAGPEMYPDVARQGVVLKDGTMQWKGKMQTAGFYRLKVKAYVDGKTYEGLCTAAFSPETLTPTTVDPEDFDAFWQHGIDEARKIPLEPLRTLLPDRCTAEVNVYELSFQNVRPGSRTFGILCVPVKPGKYPALLRVPGAGCRPYAGDIYTAAQGAITLEIGVHGIPVTMPQQVYDLLFNGALDGYWACNLDNRDKMPYKRIVLGCIRACDYLASLPEWNGVDLGVTGSSQGGFLSLATAALDPRVTCYGAVHAALCDHTASLQGRACGWPHYFHNDPTHADAKKVETSRYYDGVNFARRIKATGWFSFGYNDEVVPPTTAWATYNSVTAPKEISIYPHTAHYWCQEQWDEWEAWLIKQMHIEKQ